MIFTAAAASAVGASPPFGGAAEGDVDATVNAHVGLSEELGLNESFDEHTEIILPQPVKLPNVSSYAKVPELYGLRRDACGTGKGTEKGFSTSLKWWVLFCEHTKREKVYEHTFGLCLYSPSSFTSSTGNEQDYDRATIAAYFWFIFDNGAATPDLMTKTKQFINAHLRCEFRARCMEAGHRAPRIARNAKIGDDIEVQNIVLSVQKKKAAKSRAEYEDIQKDVNNRISEEETRFMLESIFDPKVLDGEVARMCPLYRIEFGCTFNASLQTLRRGEQSYKQKMVHRFTRIVRAIGPLPGTNCSFQVTNEAKHNRFGHLEYTGYGPHVDPIRDATGWHGVLWLYRLCIMNEKLPSFFDYANLFEVPTYPKVQAGGNHDKDSYRGLWEPFYLDAKLNVGKVTHQPRVQGEQEMDEAGIDTGDISRFAAHASASVKQSRAQLQSYLTNPPVPCMTHCSGGNHKNPRSHVAPYRISEVDEALLHQIPEVHELLNERDRVHRRYYECSTTEEREKERLHTAKGAIDSIIWEIWCAFLMFAARPVDPITQRLQFDEPTLMEKFRLGTLKPIFDMPVFASAEFHCLKASVRQSQDLYYQAKIDLDAPVRNELHQVIREEISHPISMMQMQMYQFAVDQERRAAQQRVATITPTDSAVITNNTAAAAPIALQMPPPKESDTIRDGSRNRLKRRGVSQAQLLRAEAKRDCPRPDLRDSDRGCKTLRDYWDVYEKKWAPLEKAYGSEWRSNCTVEIEPGVTKTFNGRAQWWSKRKPMYDMVLHYMEENGGDREAALDKASKIFDAIEMKGGIRRIEDIKGAFAAELKRVGKPRRKGRPLGSTKNKRPRSSSSTNDLATTPHPRTSNQVPQSTHNAGSEMFAAAFANVDTTSIPQMEEVMRASLGPEQLQEMHDDVCDAARESEQQAAAIARANNPFALQYNQGGLSYNQYPNPSLYDCVQQFRESQGAPTPLALFQQQNPGLCYQFNQVNQHPTPNQYLQQQLQGLQQQQQQHFSQQEL